jgi:hypothetical protein
MKCRYLFPFLFLLAQACFGQEKADTVPRVFPNNSVYLELGGNAVLFGSLNYERVLLHRKFFYLTARGGLGGGYIPTASILSFPVLVNTLFQFYKGGAAEVGLGATMMLIGMEEGDAGDNDFWKNGNAPMPTGTIGYRYQGKRGFLLRVNFTPFTNFSEVFYFLGLSFGYSFPAQRH